MQHYVNGEIKEGGKSVCPALIFRNKKQNQKTFPFNILQGRRFILFFLFFSWQKGQTISGLCVHTTKDCFQWNPEKVWVKNHWCKSRAAVQRDEAQISWMSLQFVQSLVISRRSEIASLSLFILSMFHGKDNREFNNSTDIPECGGFSCCKDKLARHTWKTLRLQSVFKTKWRSPTGTGTPCHLLSTPIWIDCFLLLFLWPPIREVIKESPLGSILFIITWKSVNLILGGAVCSLVKLIKFRWFFFSFEYLYFAPMNTDMSDY